MKKALEGITVLDFSQLLAGPFATMMLADLGANVIKIERAHEGDLYRKLTFFNKKLGTDTPCFMAFNRNKRSLAIDLKNSEAKKVIYDMIKQADVVVSNFRPGVMEKLGYGYEDLKKINPKIIYASNSGYGSTGPYAHRPGQDMLIQGLAGIMNLTGRKNTPPTPLGTAIPDQLGSFHLVYGILAALLYREKTGIGQEIEVDLYRATLALASQEYMTMLNLDVEYSRPESGIGHPFSDAPFGVYQCSDGYISLAVMGDSFDKFVEALENPELIKYNDRAIRFDKRDEVFNAIENVTKHKSVDHWIDVLGKADVWAAPVLDIMEVEHNEQVKHMKSISHFDHVRAGTLKCIAPAISMSETPPLIEKAPPLIGEHSQEILREFGIQDQIIEELFEKRIISQDKEG